ncbi:MAG: hypothetical protein HY326_10085, partial [Chloroflexi bacterium]|nr:hypothetical protein [Chloroflexota bacterium]
MSDVRKPEGLSRRAFLKRTLALSAALGGASLIAACAPAATPTAAPPAAAAPTQAPAAPTKAPAAPTQAPAAPTKAVEPTKAAAAPTSVAAATKPPAPPTAVPTPAVDFPAKGKAITGILTFAAGGGTDIVGRAMVPGLEKALVVPVQIVNKPGAGSATGMSEVALAKPDGYTVGLTAIPTFSTTYLDPLSKPVYKRGDFELVARFAVDPLGIAVKSDSPYKTL